MTKDEALKLALEALGAYMAATDDDEDAKAHSLMAEAFFAIKERLAQPEQEPVAWRYRTATFWNRDVHWRYLETLDGTEGLLGLKPLYTTPPQRTWVDPTAEDVAKFESWLDNEEEKSGWVPPGKIVAYISNKCKERNT